MTETANTERDIYVDSQEAKDKIKKRYKTITPIALVSTFLISFFGFSFPWDVSLAIGAVLILVSNMIFLSMAVSYKSDGWRTIISCVGICFVGSIVYMVAVCAAVAITGINYESQIIEVKAAILKAETSYAEFGEYPREYDLTTFDSQLSDDGNAIKVRFAVHGDHLSVNGLLQGYFELEDGVVKEVECKDVGDCPELIQLVN